jgi:hypothetical protein
VLERLLELSRAPHRGTKRRPAPRFHGAALEPLAPRSHGAALDGVVPRQAIAAEHRTQRRDLERGASARPSALGGNHTNVEIDQVSLERASKITEAIETRTGRPVYGSLAARVVRLAQRNELGPMLEAIAGAPIEFQPPLLVDHLERVAAGQIVDAVRPGPAPRAVALHREISAIENELGVLEGDEEWRRDGDRIEELRAQLSECQNALDQEVGIA